MISFCCVMIGAVHVAISPWLPYPIGPYAAVSGAILAGSGALLGVERRLGRRLLAAVLRLRVYAHGGIPLLALVLSVPYKLLGPTEPLTSSVSLAAVAWLVALLVSPLTLCEGWVLRGLVRAPIRDTTWETIEGGIQTASHELPVEQQQLAHESSRHASNVPRRMCQ